MKKVKTVSKESKGNIVDYVINHLEVQEMNGWYLPVRLSEAQLESCARREPLYLRALCGAGLALGFETGAKRIGFSYMITANVRDYAYCDIVVDGLLRGTVNLLEPAENGVRILKEQAQIPVYAGGSTTVRRVELTIPGTGERQVEIHLPHLTRIWLKDLTIDAPAQPLPPKEKFWLFLGDSITHGMATVHPSATYPVQAARLMNCDFINMGVCGSTYWASDLDARHRQPDLVTVALGTNDWKMAKSPEYFRQTVAEYLACLHGLYKGAKICGILPVWRADMDSVYSDMGFEELYRILHEEYAKYPEIYVVEGLDLIPHQKDYFADGVHPNEAGFLHFTMNLLLHLRKQGLLQ